MTLCISETADGYWGQCTTHDNCTNLYYAYCDNLTGRLPGHEHTPPQYVCLNFCEWASRNLLRPTEIPYDQRRTEVCDEGWVCQTIPEDKDTMGNWCVQKNNSCK